MRRRRYGAKRRRREPFYIKVTKRHGRKLSILLIFVIILTAIGWELKRFVSTSSVFNVSNAEVRTNGRFDKNVVLKIIGSDSNIFTIDLKRLTQELEARPEVKHANIVRSLPDKLIINLEERIPVAQVRANRYFPIDKEGVILPWVSDNPQRDIPLIIGIEFNTRLIKPGESYQSNNIEKALELIEAISGSKSLKKEGITKIDVRDLADISFVTDETVEVKIGEDNFKRKLELMDKVLLDAKSRGRGLNYIDLRFGDVIVGWR